MNKSFVLSGGRKITASDPVFKPVTLPDFQNGNDTLAADGNVGAAQTAWFPGLVGRADGVCNVLW
jgi:hypothetical protein